MRISCWFCLLFIFVGSLSAHDAIEKFYENRFSLYPPTEEEELAVIEIIRSFIEKINSHQVSEAYFIDTSTQFQAVTSLEDFTRFVQPLLGLNYMQKLDKHNLTFTTADKNKATFFCTLTGKVKGQNLKIDFSLENQDGEWKIMGIKIFEISKNS